MIEALARGIYRGTMTMTASAAAVAARLPGAPARWKGLAERLGRLDSVGLASAASGRAVRKPDRHTMKPRQGTATSRWGRPVR